MSQFTRFVVLVFILSFSYAGRASATTYYIAANGSDSNSGTSKTTPWLHAPGMPSCIGVCASTTPKPGDSFLFRGGDTWHRSASISGGNDVTMSGQWTWSWSGTPTSCAYPTSTSTCIYIGVDTTWFSGSSFARPQISWDNPIWANSTHQDSSHVGFVTACTYDDWNLLDIYFSSASYLIFDNFNIGGKCWSKPPNGANDIKRNGTYIDIINSYFHGWSQVYNPQCNGCNPMDQATILAGNSTPAINHNVTAFNVFDGSDSGTPCTPGGYCSGGPIEYTDAYDFHNNVVRYIANGLNSPGNVYTVHDNLFENMFESYDPADHGAVIEIGCCGSFNLPPGSASMIYNNIFRNTGMGEVVQTMTPSGGATYFFNNVMWNVSNGTNCVYIEQVDTAVPTQFYFTNNTIDMTPYGGSTCTMRVSGSTQQPFDGTIHFQNNHFIAVPGASLSGFYSIGSGSSTAMADGGGNVFQTEVAANAQGYTQGNNYAPNSSSGATVGVGANLTASCLLFSADSALCKGTGGGVSEGVGDVTIYPVISLNLRPIVGAWDAGAYMFSSASSSRPSPPMGLVATVQ